MASSSSSKQSKAELQEALVLAEAESRRLRMELQLVQMEDTLCHAVKQWFHAVAHPHPVRQSSSGSML